MKADITEIFSSVQGEGLYLGVKQIFVRFKRCNMKCTYCDVPPDLTKKEYTVPELMDEIRAREAKDGPHHSVSITGGEPLLYADFLQGFLHALKEAGFKVYLETNGTLPHELAKVIDLVDIIAMDFKLPSSTLEGDQWSAHEEFLKVSCAKEVFIKMVLTGRTTEEDIERAIAVVKTADKAVPLVLQPVHSERDAVPIDRLFGFLTLASQKGLRSVRVVPQVHKIVGIR
jgi:organic radical activating enzyme